MNGVLGYADSMVAAQERWIRRTTAGALLLLFLCLTACGGGSGDGSGNGPGNGSGNGPGNGSGSGSGGVATSTGTLKVQVTDPIGMPARFLRVSCYSSIGGNVSGYTDANGSAEVRLSEGEWTVYAVGPEFAGSAPPVTIRERETVAVAVRTYPVETGQPGVGGTSALVEAVSADGRIVEVVLRYFAVNGHNSTDSVIWDRIDGTRVEDCVPDRSNDAPSVRADCIAGPAGFDAAYAGAAASRDADTGLESPAGTPAPFEALLMLDQSAAFATLDPADHRLYAGKYLLSLTGGAAVGQRRAMLGAFAADDTAAGSISALPQKPLALFPLENPQPTADGRSLFPIVDTLATLEGGAGAMLRAVDKALDFMGANAWTGPRGLIVIGSGTDAGCGSTSTCVELRDAVIAKSKALGVRIVTIGLAGSGTAAQHESMNLLAQSVRGGAALWIDQPSQFGVAVADAQSILADTKPIASARFRIESSTPGAFVSGRTLLGKLHFEDCPWDCYAVTLPFAVKIP